MAQPDSTRKSHAVVIDVADDAEPKCCCVCTEPVEWVAVGRCGHRDVCAGCATRIRFFQDDRRCCICRAHCPTVLVTRADDDGASSSSRQQGFVLPTRLPPTAASGRVGSRAGSYWYHGATGTYFDDRRPYRAAIKLCVKPPPPPCPASQGAVAVSLGAPSQPAAGANASLDAPRRPTPVVFAVIYLCVIMVLVTMSGAFFQVADRYYQKVTIVVAFCLLSAVALVVTIRWWNRCKRPPT
ncbi:hypothetical protein C2845_PM14G14370 [Panicum miliaceum]|uniref:RING-type domain-containing protein n=1 Tax=Panicum miliaceum TaxID=4540 RepID=A0A3L6PQV6_PANMI|nr:hypothetical protein C2845_PM14G14370 [Panicum miliaceum]